jgi:hypothetical protein
MFVPGSFWAASRLSFSFSMSSLMTMSCSSSTLVPSLSKRGDASTPEKEVLSARVFKIQADLRDFKRARRGSEYFV